MNEVIRRHLNRLWSHKKLILHGLLILALLAAALALALASTAMRRAGDARAAAALAAIALVLAGLAGWGSIPPLLVAVRLAHSFPSFSFRITRGGYFYILVVFLLALAAMNSGNNLLFLLLAIFLAVILVSGVFSRLNLTGIDVRVHPPEICFAGQEVLLRVLLANRKLVWPSLGLSVEGYRKCRRTVGERQGGPGNDRWWKGWHLPAWEKNILALEPAYVPSLLPGKALSVVLPVRFRQRGHFVPGRFHLSTCFPLGFFHKGIGISGGGEFLVFPSPSGEERFRMLPRRMEGSRESLQRGWDGQFYSHRKYMDGDGVRYVDWKASAKTGELLVRENTREEQLRIHLIIDGCLPGEEERKKKDDMFEQMISDAAGVARWFLDQGAHVGLTALEAGPKREEGEASFYSLMKILALMEWYSGLADTNALSAGRLQEAIRQAAGGSEVILFTARPSPAAEDLPAHWKVEYPSSLPGL